jgi:transposase
MKGLSIEHSQATREKLLAVAEEALGAWLGLKVAVLVLLLHGYRPTFLCQLFGLSRMCLTRCVHRVNQEGVAGVRERPRSGRPTALTARLRHQLVRHLEQCPEQHGLPRAVWDGPTLVVHLRRRFGVEITVRQAQKWLYRLGCQLRRGSYVFLQARAQDAARFRRRPKKTPPVDEAGSRGV